MKQWHQDLPKGVPESYRHWLTRVRRLSHALDQSMPTQLTVLRMGTCEAATDERGFLGAEMAAKPVFIREIQLQQQDRVLSHGRLCIPDSTWDLIGEQVLALGERPIGETLLHHDQNISRSVFVFAPAESLVVYNPDQRPVWSRRSRFMIKNQWPLWLTETLSPMLP